MQEKADSAVPLPVLPCGFCGRPRPFHPRDLVRGEDDWTTLPAGKWPCPHCDDARAIKFQSWRQ